MDGVVSPASCRLSERLCNSLFGTSLVHKTQFCPSSSHASVIVSLRAAVTTEERGEERGRVTSDRLLPSGSLTQRVTKGEY